MGRTSRWLRRFRKTGERTAHHIDLLALLDDDSLREATQALAADPAVSERIDRATIGRLTAPRNYLGLAPEMVDRVLGSVARDA
jgi:3-carboxy-cis,cis-muconate cycloisomerase